MVLRFISPHIRRQIIAVCPMFSDEWVQLKFDVLKFLTKFSCGGFITTGGYCLNYFIRGCKMIFPPNSLILSIFTSR